MKRKTKVICGITSAITMVGGFYGMFGFAILFEKYRKNICAIAALICFILFIGGIILAAIIKFVDDFTYNKKPKYKPPEKTNNEYQYLNSNTKQERWAKQEGDEGEETVRLYLGQTIEGEKYVINNLILSNKDKSKSSQIDHVFINKYGIWCIETKNWGGMIFGRETDNTWTQVFNYGEEKYKQYNPIKQNETHVYFLKKELGLNKEIHNIVIFTNGNISNVKAENIYYVEELYKVLWENNNIELSNEEMEIYYNKLLKIKATQISDEQHVININSKIA